MQVRGRGKEKGEGEWQRAVEGVWREEEEDIHAEIYRSELERDDASLQEWEIDGEREREGQWIELTRTKAWLLASV